MKFVAYIGLGIILFTGCAATMALVVRGPKADCEQRVCPEAAKDQEAGHDSSTYDPYDNTCICLFRDGRYYTTRR